MSDCHAPLDRQRTLILFSTCRGAHLQVISDILAAWGTLLFELLYVGGAASCLSPTGGNLVDGLLVVVHNNSQGTCRIALPEGNTGAGVQGFDLARSIDLFFRPPFACAPPLSGVTFLPCQNPKRIHRPLF